MYYYTGLLYKAVRLQVLRQRLLGYCPRAVLGIGLRAVELLMHCTMYILKLAGWLDAAGAAGLYRRSVKRWYWVLVCVP